MRAEKREANRYLVYSGGGGKWSIPWPIVSCESGGSFVAQNGRSTASGAYQILDGTWRAHGGGAFASRAASAVPRHQHIVAGRIYKGGSGRSQWAC